MPKDYAKYSHTKRKKSRNKKKKSHIKLWFFTLLGLVFLILGLTYLSHKHNMPLEKGTKTHHLTKQFAIKKPPVVTTTPTANANKSGSNKTQEKEPEFDFYSILPKLKVKPDAAARATTEQYVLVIAKEDNHAAADAWQAKLALLGFDVSIEKIDVQGAVIYKVLVGPYSNKKSAEADLARLRENKISGKLRPFKTQTKD